MKIPDSGSKWFLPMHYTIMALILLFSIFISRDVHGFDENGDRFCLAQNIYFEAGNQPFIGRYAVANVTLNRVNDLQFPNTVCEVVYQSKSYTSFWFRNTILSIKPSNITPGFEITIKNSI